MILLLQFCVLVAYCRQLLARPTKLALVKGEAVGSCTRKLGDPVQLDIIEGVEAMADLVGRIASEQVSAAQAAARAAAAAAAIVQQKEREIASSAAAATAATTVGAAAPGEKAGGPDAGAAGAVASAKAALSKKGGGQKPGLGCA